MRAIINGKRYDTATAELVADISPAGYGRSDFHYEDTGLYRTPRGNWFLAGEGGAMSRWSRPVGQNGYAGGDGVQAVSPGEARRLLEIHQKMKALEQYFADSIEDA